MSDKTVVNMKDAWRVTSSITYGKGAAYQKQLQKIMGEKKYKATIRNVIQNYKWSNLTIDDFIQEVEKVWKN